MRSADDLLHELHVHQTELEMQNEILRESQIQLEKSRDYFMEFYDFFPVGYLTLTRDGLISAANLTCASLLGVERSKLVNRLFAPFVATEDRDNWHRFFSFILKHADKQSLNVQLQRNDGFRLFAQLDCLSLAPKGEESMVHIVLTDITSRTQAEIALQKNLHISNLVQSIAHVGSWEFDLTTGQLAWSDELSRIFGIAPETFTPSFETLINLIHPEDQAAVQAWINACSLGQKPKVLEFRCVWSDATIHYIEGHCELGIDATGKPSSMSGTCQEITDRKLMENELQISEDKFSKVFHGSPDPILISEIDTGVVCQVNPSFFIVFGYSAEEVIGNTTTELGFWLDECSRNETISIIESQGYLHNYEVRQQTKDGQVLTMLSSASTAYFNNKSYLVVHLRDITERKLTEQIVHDQRARLDGLIDAAMDAIVSSDESQNITMFNHAAELMFGYRAKDVIGQPLDLLIPIRFRERHRKHVDMFGKTAVTRRTMARLGESYGLRANGEEFPFEASISRVEVSGSLILTAIVRDITLQKRAESELRVAATAFESQQSLMITDANRVIMRVNKAFAEETGYTADEIIGQTPRIFKSGRHNSAFYHAMWESINRTGAWQGEIWDRRKNGDIYPKWLTISAVKDDNGVITHYVGSHTDITEHKQAEAEHLASLAAEAANRAKSEFLANMSHELRTPLNAILGFGQLLDMDPQIRSLDQRESISHILSSGQQLLELINDLLDFARIDIGKLHINSEPLCMADIAASCVAQVSAAMARQKNIVMENTLTDTSLLVQGDNQRVRQVLINLLSNAVKYNRENGRVTVGSRIGPAGRLQIEVRDTGVGIASDKLPLLFSPFERIDQKHGAISGVGIGLHITKQLVEAMGGTVGVDSEPGKGSTFWFELPLAEQADESTAVPVTSQPVLHGDARFVVLYIEDNPVNLKLVQAALKNRPAVELLTADTAEAGMTIASEDRPDLILMDMRLPGIDGITATALLKENDATRDIPVVALSADAHQKDIDRALSAGCSYYLTKPIQLQALYELIDRVRLENKNI